MHLKTFVVGSCFFALCCFSTVAQTAGTLSTADKDFLTFAAQTDMTEAHLGQLAQENAGRQDVKDYGNMLSQDHTSNYNELVALGTKVGADIPKGIDAAHDRMIAPLAKAKGAAFDRRFLQDMVRGHTQAIAMFRKEADHGENADVKTFAQNTIPTLEKHLHDAEALLKTKPGAKATATGR